MTGKRSTEGRHRTRHLMIYTFLLILVLLFLASRRQRIAMETEQKIEETRKQEEVQKEALAKKKRTEEPASGLVLEPEEMWSLVLTNESHPVPDDYQPELSQIPGTEESIDTRVYDPLAQMLDAMREQGMSPEVCSGYRTKEKQTELFEQEKKQHLEQGMSEEEAYREAARYVSVPEAGEHRLGLAADILSAGCSALDEGFGDTPEGLWLREHASEYGFILRYDRGKEALTGISYEPWHFRYVGVEAARYMMEKGMCLEEFFEAESLYE